MSLKPYLLWAGFAMALNSAAGESGAVRPIALDEALTLSLSRNLEREELESSAAAASELARQASSLPNPELELEAEAFGGSGDAAGFGGAETSARLTQPLNLSGRRKAAAQAAAANTRRAQEEVQLHLRRLKRETYQLFHELLACQERAALADRRLARANKVLDMASERVAAGKASPLDQARAETDVSQMEIERASSIQQRLATARQLAGLWGQNEPVEAEGNLFAKPSADWSLETMRKGLEQHPELVRWSHERARAAADAREARAARSGDVAVTAGYQRFEESGDSAFTAGLALPLPLWDRNGGAIAAAGHDARRVEIESASARVQARRSLEDAYSDSLQAMEALRIVEEKALPAARGAAEGMQEGYRSGKFDLTAVLDAEEAVANVETARIEAYAAAHRAQAALEYWRVPANH